MPKNLVFRNLFCRLRNEILISKEVVFPHPSSQNHPFSEARRNNTATSLQQNLNLSGQSTTSHDIRLQSLSSGEARSSLQK